MSKGDWQRVTKARPCPVCGKPDWCVFAGLADAPQTVLCARIKSPRRIGAAGWLHRLRESVTAWPPYERTIRRAVRMMSEPADGKIDLPKLAADFARAVRPVALGRLAVSRSQSSRYQPEASLPASVEIDPSKRAETGDNGRPGRKGVACHWTALTSWRWPSGWN